MTTHLSGVPKIGTSKKRSPALSASGTAASQSVL